MTVTLALVVAVTVVVRTQQQPPPPAPQPPAFRSDSSDLVVLPVTVTDDHGELVTDLDRDRFVVYDNGRRQDVRIFTNEDTPVSVGLIIDDSASMRPKMGEVIAATLAFAKGSNPQDEIFTLVFNERVHDALPGQTISAANVDALQAALDRLRPDGQTALYDGLMAGLDHAAASTRERKVLILVSDGGDNASHASLADVLARARASSVIIYTIGLFDRDDPDANPDVLKKLARTTGGERFLPPSAGPMIRACTHVAREIRSGYTIGYVPPDRDGTFHHVRVQVTPSDHRKFLVRTRPGYFAAEGPR
jgi:VWFA-related protein